MYCNLENRPTLENNPNPFLNEVVAKGGFLLKVRPPISVVVHAVMAIKKQGRACSTV